MDGRISAGDWALLLLPLGTPLYAILCAQLGQRIAYARGYLKRGYVMGLLGGPAGLLACLSLPRIPEPLLEIEAILHYGCDDPQSRRWRGSFKWSLLLLSYAALVWLSIPGWVPARIEWFQPPLDLAGHWWLHLPLLLAGAAFCWFSFTRQAQPPLHFLRPLPAAAGPGMGELLHWTSLRFVIARAIHYSALLEYFGGWAIMATLTLLLLFGLSFVDTKLSWPLRALLLALALAAGYGSRLLLLRNIAIERALEDLRVRARQELGADPLRHAAPVLSQLAPGGRAPESLLQRLDDKAREVMRDSRGLLGRDSARPLAAATLDADASTRRLLFLKPALALGGIYLLFKMVELSLRSSKMGQSLYEGMSELGRRISAGEYELIRYSLAFLLGLLLLLWLLTHAQRRLLRRRSMPDPD